MWGVHVSFYDGDTGGAAHRGSRRLWRVSSWRLVHRVLRLGRARVARRVPSTGAAGARSTRPASRRRSARAAVRSSSPSTGHGNAWPSDTPASCVAARRSVDTIVEVYRPISEINIVRHRSFRPVCGSTSTRVDRYGVRRGVAAASTCAVGGASARPDGGVRSGRNASVCVREQWDEAEALLGDGVGTRASFECHPRSVIVGGDGEDGRRGRWPARSARAASGRPRCGTWRPISATMRASRSPTRGME